MGFEFKNNDSGGKKPSTDGVDSASDIRSKLCMDVMAERWAKSSGGTSKQFTDGLKQQLNAPTASPEQLDEKFTAALEAEEEKRHGSSTGRRMFDEALKAWKCK